MALSLSFFPFFSLFFFILASRSVGSEPPPPPLPATTFHSTSQSFDSVLYRGNLLEFLGGSSLHRIPSLLSARLCRSSGCRDLLRRWLFEGHPDLGISSGASLSHLLYLWGRFFQTLD
uniref:Legume lectin domain-containing protein n=1 Tax=Fagus sylvatica TaxID=28930 RepID=A0A2N9GBA8_FAGSY